MGFELRSSSALKLLLEVALEATQKGEPDLSFRQISVLLTLYLYAPPHSVTQLASTLKVAKSVITRALDHLGTLGLIARERDVKDQRKLVIHRTVKGALFIERLAKMLINHGNALPASGFTQFNQPLNLDALDLERLSYEL